MKILHAYCLNTNIGDYYLGIGVKNLLRHYLDIELIAETNLQGTVFNDYYIENVINKRYDLLVIGGGGIIHGAHWPNGWFWLIKEELIRKIKIPFIVYAAGYNYFKNEGGIPVIGRSHLRETLKRATYFSVRNDGSFGRFAEEMNVEVPEIPDPGFHIGLNRSYGCNETQPFVVIQLANDKPEHRFEGSGGLEKFVVEMRKVVHMLANNYRVILTPHVYEDLPLSHQIVNGIPNACVWEFSRYAFDRASESVGYYKNAEFVLAMRGHGQIVPIAFNTPVISMDNHPKHLGLMKKLGINEYNVSVSSDELSGEILEKISHLEANIDSYRKELSITNKRLSIETSKAFKEISMNLKKVRCKQDDNGKAS